MKSKVVQLLGLLAILAVSSASAQAAIDDTTIADTAAHLTTGFGLIKTLIIGVVTFGVIIGYVKLLRKK